MQKTLIGIGALLAVLVVVFFIVNSFVYTEKQEALGSNEKNAEYLIGGARVQLKDGVSEVESAPGSASRTITRYFGNAVSKDLNADGKEDVAFILTQEGGGSGTFYYLVAALQTDNGYVGSEAVLLGDRIAPQQTQLDAQGNIVVTYADRAPGEDFSVAPSVGKSMVLKFDAAARQFGEVAQDFPGEADPNVMTLSMKKWEWVSASYEDGRTITPKKAGAFTLTFTDEKSFSASTDCNGVGGEYSAKDGVIAFDKMMSTMMYCEDSQEAEFSQMLTNTTGYDFTAKGELVLHLKFDSGTVLFR